MIVDSKEASSNPEIVKNLQNIGVDFKVESLPAGDYYIPSVSSKDLVLERKSNTDLVRSIRDRSIWEQLILLSSWKEIRPCILFEGSPTVITKWTDWSEGSIMGVFLSILFDWNFQILYTPSERWTVITLKRLYDRLGSSKKKELFPVGKPMPRGLTLEEQARRVIEAFPNISAARADLIQKHFRSVNNFIRNWATVDEISGIGPKIKDGIGKVIMYEHG